MTATTASSVVVSLIDVLPAAVWVRSALLGRGLRQVTDDRCVSLRVGEERGAASRSAKRDMLVPLQSKCRLVHSHATHRINKRVHGFHTPLGIAGLFRIYVERTAPVRSLLRASKIHLPLEGKVKGQFCPLRADLEPRPATLQHPLGSG